MAYRGVFGEFNPPPPPKFRSLTNLSRNSLKVPKIKNILLYVMNFLVPNYSCLQNPWLGGYRPQIPSLSVLCPKPNLLNPLTHEQNFWVHYCCTELVAYDRSYKLIPKSTESCYIYRLFSTAGLIPSALLISNVLTVNILNNYISQMKPTRCTIFSVYLVNFIYNLYMFRTSPGPSSGGTTVFMQHLVLVILYKYIYKIDEIH
jgi:hypothetical protein